MNIQEFEASLDYLVKAELTPFIWGHAGIGKSAIAKQWAHKKGYKFFPFYLGTQADSGDILGLQNFTKTESGRPAVEHSPPLWIVEMIEYCEQNPDSGAVIFLDEFNRGRRDILNGMFSLALDKTFHTITFPKNCHIIAAGNPPTDEYFTTDVNETALMSRFVHIKLEPTVDEWLTYANERGIDESFIGFIKSQPQLLEEVRSEFELPVKVDRRAWERASRLAKTGVPTTLLNLLLPGIVGLERVIAYLAYLRDSEKPLTTVEILSGSKFDLVAKWCAPDNILSSFLNNSCDNLKKDIPARTENLTVDEKVNLMKFLKLVPLDISFPVINGLVTSRSEVFKEFSVDPLYQNELIEIVKTAKGKTDTADKVEKTKKAA